MHTSLASMVFISSMLYGVLGILKLGVSSFGSSCNEYDKICNTRICKN